MGLRGLNMIRVQVMLIWVVYMMFICGLACGREQLSENEVRGVVLEVQAISATDLKSLAIRDESGLKWYFEAVDYKGKSPSHLRMHMVQGLPVIVRYHREQTIFVLDEIID